MTSFNQPNFNLPTPNQQNVTNTTDPNNTSSLENASVNNNAMNNMFTDLNNPTGLKRGSVVVFNYMFWMHDPYPFIIVTDFIPGKRVRGLNLHYLTFPFIKNMLQIACSTKTFSYINIKDNSYIVKAFRSYKWQGIRQVKILDCDFVLRIMGIARSFNQNEIDAMRKSVQEQLNQPTNPPAQPTLNQNNVNPSELASSGDQGTLT